MNKPQQLAIFGATGSIGTSTLAVVDLHPNRFSIFALSANTNWQKMQILCEKYQPKFAIMVDELSAKKLKLNLNNSTIVLSGADALNEVVAYDDLDTVMAAIVGSAGMQSTLNAIKFNKRVLLANKEALILSGDLLMSAFNNSQAQLLPVDSEHSAIHQCLGAGRSGLKKIQLTASGGPFLHTPLSQLKTITPKQACKHPNWDMGAKISVDSATMMNKGLEIIEAFYLFGVSADNIEVVIHPESVIHSVVSYKDGSSLAQLGLPDMRCAISYALFHPDRQDSGVADLSLADYQNLSFYQPDLDKFPCLKLSIDALKQGGSAMGALNAANEVAVSAFLKEQTTFLDIAKVIEKTLEAQPSYPVDTLDSILENDKTSRLLASQIVNKL